MIPSQKLSKSFRKKLLHEWHSKKNGKLTLTDAINEPNIPRWWICPKGHSWRTSILNRISGTSCPFCNRQSVYKENCLAEIRPELAKEWDYEKNKDTGLTPDNVKSKSGKKVGWVCPKGHRYDAVIASRTSGTGCPYCSNNKVSIENSLFTLKPELVQEWDLELNGELTPKDVTPGSKKKVYWRCKKNKEHSWRAAIFSRVHGRGCPYCAHQRVSKDNCLATINPELAAEWHSTKNDRLTPKDVLPSGKSKVWWKCGKCGHEYKATINHRATGYGCPACSGRVASERNSIATLKPDLAKEFHPTKNKKLTPDNVSVFSDKEIWWQCSHGHLWEMSANRRSRINGCPYCNHQLASHKYNLATENPELAAEWHPTKNSKLKPQDVLPYSNKKVWWECQRKHSYKASVANRANGNGCPYCHPNTSRNEIRILSEILVIFPDARKSVIQRKEIDVFIPELNIGIEYDGYYFHKDGIDRDREKNDVLERSGITLFRFREGKLPRISVNDILLNGNELKVEDIINLLKKIQAKVDLSDKYRRKIQNYIKGGKFTNDKEYFALLKEIKIPPREKSLAFLFPEIAAQLHPTLNNGITSDLIYAHSGIKYFWQCDKNKDHVWEATADHRSRGTGCPLCAGRKVKI